MDTVIHEQASYMLGKCGLARAHLAIEEQQKTKVSKHAYQKLW